MLILGLNMFHADASAAIVENGKILFAVAEERLNRHKHYGGFPALAVKACLDAAGAEDHRRYASMVMTLTGHRSAHSPQRMQRVSSFNIAAPVMTPSSSAATSSSSTWKSAGLACM